PAVPVPSGRRMKDAGPGPVNSAGSRPTRLVTVWDTPFQVPTTHESSPGAKLGDAGPVLAAAPVAPALVAAGADAGGALVAGDWAMVLMPPEHAASDSPATQGSAVSMVTRYTFMRAIPL